MVVVNTIYDFLKLSISAGVISAIIVFLSQSIWGHWLNRDLEKYKNLLAETVKQNEIKFSKLHHDRAEILRELYSRLIDLIDDLKDMVRICSDWNHIFDLNDKQTSIDNYKNEYTAFFSFVHKNRIFFNKNTCALLEKIEQVLISPFNEIISTDCGVELSPTTKSRLIFQGWAEYANDMLELELLDLKLILENEFRNMLGIN